MDEKYVLVMFNSDETISVSEVRGPFDSKDQALATGIQHCGVEGSVEEDEYGRFVNDDGDPLFSVDVLCSRDK